MTLWRKLTGRGALERELDAELRDHIERRVADLKTTGLADVEARRRARAEFGGLDQAKEYCRDVRGTRWFEDLVMDLRYGLRMLAASRTFTLVAVFSLALGIGANTAIFTLVNSLLLKTLPVHEPERLVRVDGEWTNPIWEEIKSRQHDLFAGAAAWSATRFDLSRGGQEQPVEGLWASGEFFGVYGVRAILGRTFTAENDQRGGGSAATVAVISYAFWQRHYGGAADAVGKTLTLNRVPFTVIGVTPPGFAGPVMGRSFDVAVPLRTVDVLESGGQESRLDGRSTWWLDITARLKDNQSIEQATAALRGVQPAIREATTPTNWPAEHLKEYLREALALSSSSQGPAFLRQQFEQPLVTIMTVVGLVLLIACANIATLMLARAAGRRHELTMRLALGASRARVARQLLTESLLLAGIGALLGLGFAQWGSTLLVSQFTTDSNPLTLDLALDWRVLGFTAAVAVLTALLFGVAPAMTTRRLAPMDALKEQGRGAGGGRHSMTSPFVVAQIALSVVLLVGAGLFLQTFYSLLTREVGFDRESILLANVDIQRSQIDESRRADLYARLAEAAARVPGVERAAASLLTPVSGMGWNNAFEIPDQPQLSIRQRLSFINAVTAGWHSVYGMRLVGGREFSEADREGAPPVVIVNEAFAKKFLKPGSALGQIVQPSERPDGQRPPAMEVVGVVRDAAYRNLREEIPPTIFIPMAQSEIVFPSGAVAVRTSLEPLSLVRSLTEALTRVDPDVSIAFRPLSDQVAGRMVRERVMAMLGGFFGLLALLLSAVGLFGVTSYSVNLRRAEIGVRMALGADISRVIRLVLGRSTRLVVLGVAIGVGLSLWLAKFVGTLLYGLEPRDTATLVIAVVMMLVIGTVAAFIPAWRAARIEPVEVLREG
jgi:putative ABC transport system permease protein